jgi:nucleotide-binding universal stress UspA family protein
MDTYYENILVPVSNALTTKKSVARAIGLASPGRSIIHLAQLIHTWNPFGSLTAPTAYEADSKAALDIYIKTLLNLMRWKDLIEKQGHVVKVKIHIRRGPPLNLFIQDLVRKTPIDLIIITCDKTKKWLPGAHAGPGDRIARETQCAVLTLNTQKKRGIREEIEMLSEPVLTPRHINKSDYIGRFGLTGAYSLLSGN